MTNEERPDWSPVRKLMQRVLEQGDALELSDDTRDLLRRSAREVAISPEDTEDSLRGVATATTLLQEIRRRIEDGSFRLSKARAGSERLRVQGDLSGAKTLLEEVLAIEVVPFYREQAEVQFEKLTRLEAVFVSGRVDADLYPWGQIEALAHRIQQGRPLELHDDLHAFLRETAPSVAISEAEADMALENVEGAKALLRKMLERIQDGRRRISKALDRMMTCREAGDREGALQALRDVLAVEVVPKFRQMAQENLDRYDEPPPAL
ncbi:DUF2379 family protein [Myxococcaceae bacterium GXIMD 01537]